MTSIASLPKFTDTAPVEEIIRRIVVLNEGLARFWTEHSGWAPKEAAELLTKSRLDWQASLSRSLVRWVVHPEPRDWAGTQILGYANLGALVEGTLKLFLSVWYNDYRADADAIIKQGKLVSPDGAELERLRQFFKKRIWIDTPEDAWDAWILRIQNRRNAIHAFRDRAIGTHVELMTDIRCYLRFLRRVNSQLPYPNDFPCPLEDYDYRNEFEWRGDYNAPII